MTEGPPAGPDEQFPRARSLPRQSPLFWVAEKDRYLRQLLIRDIQTATGRPLVVYFASTTASRAQIAQGDDVYFTELLRDTKEGVADLLIETSGGFTDATEKIASILRETIEDLRVIVPCRAKSNGTMLALIGSCIVMGVGSELGPADPFITIAPNNTIPAHFLLAAQNVDPIFREAAQHAIDQTTKLAKQLLSTGMMQGKPNANIDQVGTSAFVTSAVSVARFGHRRRRSGASWPLGDQAVARRRALATHLAITLHVRARSAPGWRVENLRRGLHQQQPKSCMSPHGERAAVPARCCK